MFCMYLMSAIFLPDLPFPLRYLFAISKLPGIIIVRILLLWCFLSSYSSVITFHPYLTALRSHEIVHFCASCGLLYPAYARHFLWNAMRLRIEALVVVLAWWPSKISGFDSQYTGEFWHPHFGHIYKFITYLIWYINTACTHCTNSAVLHCWKFG